MFGVGRDAGLTTIRLRHAWGQWKQIGAGQTNSQFMDVDVFPNVIDYWGPNGMLFFRNTQVFYEFRNDEKWQAAAAIEAPGASGDAGVYADRIELQNIKPRFPMPDITGHVRMKGKKGYVQVGGIVRKISHDWPLPNDAFDLSGSVVGRASARTSTSQKSRRPSAAVQSGRHPELLQRCAGRHRGQRAIGQYEDADCRRRAAGAGPRALHRPRVERKSPRRPVTHASTSTTAICRPNAYKSLETTTCSARSRRMMGAGFGGHIARTNRTASGSTTSESGGRSSYSFGMKFGG